MKILVTGCEDLIGTRLVELLRSAGEDAYRGPSRLKCRKRSGGAGG